MKGLGIDVETEGFVSIEIKDSNGNIRSVCDDEPNEIDPIAWAGSGNLMFYITLGTSEEPVITNIRNVADSLKTTVDFNAKSLQEINVSETTAVFNVQVNKGFKLDTLYMGTNHCYSNRFKLKKAVILNAGDNIRITWKIKSKMPFFITSKDISTNSISLRCDVYNISFIEMNFDTEPSYITRGVKYSYLVNPTSDGIAFLESLKNIRKENVETTLRSRVGIKRSIENDHVNTGNSINITSASYYFDKDFNTDFKTKRGVVLHCAYGYFLLLFDKDVDLSGDTKIKLNYRFLINGNRKKYSATGIFRLYGERLTFEILTWEQYLSIRNYGSTDRITTTFYVNPPKNYTGIVLRKFNNEDISNLFDISFGDYNSNGRTIAIIITSKNNMTKEEAYKILNGAFLGVIEDVG